jgi:hypothetical protein
MKKLSLYIFVGLLFCNTVHALPKCKGTNQFKWHNCSGTEKLQDGGKYEGEHQNGDFNGQGTAIWASGEKYVGEWKDSKRHEQGTNIYAGEFAGDKYVGEFKDNERHGQGTYTFADGRVKKGTWENGKLVKP